MSDEKGTDGRAVLCKQEAFSRNRYKNKGRYTAITLKLQGSENKDNIHSDFLSLCEVYGYDNKQLLPDQNTSAFERSDFK